MSKYTTELHYLIESGFDVGLTDYPIFDEAYRPVLNQLILDHYRFREIGFETPGLFKHYLNLTMRENMPLYNKLYNAMRLEYDILGDVKLTETSHRASDGESTGESSGTVHGQTDVTGSQADDLLHVKSDMPGGMLSIGDIKTNTFASEADRSDNSSTNSQATVNDSQGDNSNSGTMHTVDDYLRTLTGKGSGAKNFSEMISDYRKSLVNVDIMVIDSLRTCFMGVF